MVGSQIKTMHNVTTFPALRYKIFKTNSLIFCYLLHHNDNNLYNPTAGKAPLAEGSEPEASQKCVLRPEGQASGNPHRNSVLLSWSVTQLDRIVIINFCILPSSLSLNTYLKTGIQVTISLTRIFKHPLKTAFSTSRSYVTVHYQHTHLNWTMISINAEWLAQQYLHGIIFHPLMKFCRCLVQQKEENFLTSAYAILAVGLSSTALLRAGISKSSWFPVLNPPSLPPLPIRG